MLRNEALVIEIPRRPVYDNGGTDCVLLFFYIKDRSLDILNPSIIPFVSRFQTGAGPESLPSLLGFGNGLEVLQSWFSLVERKFRVGQYVRIIADDETNGEIGFIFEWVVKGVVGRRPDHR